MERAKQIEGTLDVCLEWEEDFQEVGLFAIATKNHRLFLKGDVMFVFESNGAGRFEVLLYSTKGYRVINYMLRPHFYFIPNEVASWRVSGLLRAQMSVMLTDLVAGYSASPVSHDSRTLEIHNAMMLYHGHD